MKKINKYIILFVILLVIILADVFILSLRKDSKNQKPEVADDPNTIVYYCKEGIIKAIYGDNTVTLTFADGHQESMNISMSASGARYESGSRVFWTKGENAFMMDGDSQIYSKCVAGSVSSSQDGNTYTDRSKAFSLSYPSIFNIYGGDAGYTTDWSYLSSQTSGVILAEVYVPKSFLPNTNFSEAKFTVGTSSMPEAVDKCLKPNTIDGGGKSEEVVIGEKRFMKNTLIDAGAGNYYAITSYHTIYNDSCYSLEYKIHYTNIANYSPDQGIKEFDIVPVTAIFDSMVENFKFLK